ncbi:MAG: hypothetical protein ACE5PO_02140 [Candidatus Bathyarchaeia archaeon]
MSADVIYGGFEHVPEILKSLRRGFEVNAKTIYSAFSYSQRSRKIENEAKVVIPKDGE